MRADTWVSSLFFFYERYCSTLLACLLASIQPRTSLVKFARSPRTDPPGLRLFGCVGVWHGRVHLCLPRVRQCWLPEEERREAKRREAKTLASNSLRLFRITRCMRSLLPCVTGILPSIGFRFEHDTAPSEDGHQFRSIFLAYAKVYDYIVHSRHM